MSVQADDVQIRYDATGDVLYVSLGEPRAAYGVPDQIIDNLIVRYDPIGHQVVAVTIVGFRRTDLPTLQTRLPFPVDFSRLQW